MGGTHMNSSTWELLAPGRASIHFLAWPIALFLVYWGEFSHDTLCIITTVVCVGILLLEGVVVWLYEKGLAADVRENSLTYRFIRWCVRKNLLREGEVSKRTTEMRWYIIGVTIAVWLSPQLWIALLCVTWLAVGDPAARTFGVLFRKWRIPFLGHKSSSWQGVIGFIAMSLVATVVTLWIDRLGGRSIFPEVSNAFVLFTVITALVATACVEALVTVRENLWIAVTPCLALCIPWLL